MRLSNKLPHSSAQVDLTRHLTCGDVIFGLHICTVIVKWSKTMQDRKETTTIAIPALGPSPLCPMVALQNMFALIPASKNSPLFSVYKHGLLVPLSDCAIEVYIFLIFCSFRRSATTWAFQNGVSLQEIIKHVAWSSDVVWIYIKPVPSSSSQVSCNFQQQLYF